MISQAAGDGDQIYISLDPFFDRLFGQVWGGELTSVKPKFRLALKGDVIKQTYLFYLRQVSAGHKGVYKIHLEKFCDYIGLRNKQPWPQKRYLVRKAHEKLMELKFFDSYEYDLSKDLIIVTLKSDDEDAES